MVYGVRVTAILINAKGRLIKTPSQYGPLSQHELFVTLRISYLNVKMSYYLKLRGLPVTVLPYNVDEIATFVQIPGSFSLSSGHATPCCPWYCIFSIPSLCFKELPLYLYSCALS